MARLHPGVYVEEVPGGAKAIEAASTSTAIFVGETERGPLDPVKIKSWTEFQRAFGGYLKHTVSGSERILLPDSVFAFFNNGGTTAYVLRVTDVTNPGAAKRAVGGIKLLAGSPGQWGNSVEVALLASSDADPQRFRIAVIYRDLASGERRIVEDFDRLSWKKTDAEGYVVDVLKRSAYVRWDPTTPPTGVPTLDNSTPKPTQDAILALTGLAMSTGSGGTSTPAATRYAAELPRLDTVTDASLLVLPGLYDEYQKAGAAYVIGKRPLMDLFYVADVAPQSGQAVVTDAVTAVRNDVFVSPKITTDDYVGVYWPWVECPDPVGGGKDPVITLPPSGFVAGIYARTDARRGVWKAPAGIEASVLGIRGPEYKVLDTHQDDLNPIGVNALRVMPGAGAVVWGARTTQPNGEWRYVPVRRTAMFLRKSIYDGIQWAVFEPNDEPLWASLRATAGAFMEQLFRQGAFAGRTSREAYFVKCDAETTPEIDQVAGVVNLWVGFAPLRPAEFVVVKLSQMTQQKS